MPGRTQTAPLREDIRIGDVTVRFSPAGHVLGSAQIAIEAGGTRVVVSGDYKRDADPTCLPYEVVPCDVFITEATFGLPVFRHPDTRDEVEQAARFASRCFPSAPTSSAPTRSARRSGSWRSSARRGTTARSTCMARWSA